jgi:anti-anti-sigma factor
VDFSIRVDGDGDRRIVRLSGQCDLACAPQLREALQDLGPPSVLNVVVDVSDLEFIDSTCLGIVFGALRRLRDGGGDLTLAGADGVVRRVLEVSGLDQVIKLT